MGKLEDAIEFLDLEDWISQYVETKHGGIEEIRIQECPKCFNDNWKVYINVEKKIWFCQRCQWGHHLNDVCVLMAEISDRNVHSIRQELLSTVVPSLTDDEFMLELNKQLENTNEAEEFRMDPIDLPGDPEFEGVMGGKAVEYLKKRGLTDEDIAYYGLRMSNKLRNNMGPWAVFPVIFYGVPVACQGRKFSNQQEPKYMSSDKIANWLWPLDDNNLKMIKESGEVILVEGVFDALAYVKNGMPALCTFGKNLSRNQIKLLNALGVKRIFLAYDADAHKSIQETADRVGHMFHAFIVELPPLPENPKADPGDVLAGIVNPSWLKEAMDNTIDTRTPEYWNWKLRKELSI